MTAYHLYILNYEIEGRDGRRQVVHVNRLKRVHDQDFWNAQSKRKSRKGFPKRSAEHSDSDTEEGFRIGPFPMVTPNYPAEGTDFQNQVLDTPGSAQQPLDAPSSEQRDPSYRPPETPRSRRELQATRDEPPVTRSRTRILSQENANAQSDSL
jgi:hypothetical protein